ncbi:hypothetical protein [Histidinibacterium aquaticum]|uniref:Uncharacterized protein n=1 Tax=Histidinibacterium aquaticum TaxID=2613962 RepID=A0A5J5GE27_9RHOB|nr:hypothetical protein [Histidinibacterium aquaticum]KAA9006062.1 hypothetical protein F3S47_16045 [Histidinibacterium aquaticum]
MSLSPFYGGDGDVVRDGLEILRHLTILPDEVRTLSEVDLEIRGTRISDLRPLAKSSGLREVNFEGIPAAIENPELEEISTIENSVERTRRLKSWLEVNYEGEPPEAVEGGPEFRVDDVGPITLIDTPLIESDDDDQAELQKDCEEKASSLAEVAELATNTAPDLPSISRKYQELISQNANLIGARRIWSIANSLEAILEIHDRAVADDRHSEELPASVAARLKDLAETHRVWFLGHPGARAVEERANKHARKEGYQDRRRAAVSVVEAAERSTAVSADATWPARQNIETSKVDSAAGVAALGELEDWAWNFVASIARKAWTIAKAPPGGFVGQAVSGHYLILFIVNNDDAIRHYAYTAMSQGPLWWDALEAAIRRMAASGSNHEDRD